MARTNVTKISVRFWKNSEVVPTSDTTAVNYIVLYLNNILQTFGHRELVVFVEHGDRVYVRLFSFEFLG